MGMIFPSVSDSAAFRLGMTVASLGMLGRWLYAWREWLYALERWLYVCEMDWQVVRECEKNKEVDIESIVSQRPMSDQTTGFNEHIGRPDLRAIVEKAYASELGGRIAFAGMSSVTGRQLKFAC